MQIIGSPNITDFAFRACIDLSTTTSSMVLTDKSTSILDGFEGIIFNIYAPSGLLIHEGDWSSPDIVNEGDSYTFSPLVFMGGVLMTGTYKIEAYIKDQNGTVYQWSDNGTTFKTIEVCLPNSLDGASGYYGGMLLKAETDCDNMRLCFFDNTSYTYKGISGSFVSTSLKVIYPPDPNTFEQLPAQSYTLIPSCYTITVNGRYQFQSVRIVTYELGNDTCITFRYQFTNENYIVSCNADLCGIQCDYARLLNDLDEAICDNNTANISKYGNQVIQITGLITQFNENKKCGESVDGILDKIIEIGGFDCESCSPSAIVANPIICNNGVFTVITPCGDIEAEVTQEGNNIQISLQDTTYTFVIDQASQTYLTKTTQVSGCTSQTTFALDLSTITDRLCKVAISADDSCCNYLEDKLTSSDSSLTITKEADEEGCETLDIVINEPAWTTFAFGTAFGNEGGSKQIAQIRKWANGKVEIRGEIHATNYPTSTVISTLDAIYRPSLTQYFPVNVNVVGTYQSGEIFIPSSGSFQLICNPFQAGTAGVFSINISYYAPIS